MNKWDKRYLGLAEYISRWSLDPSTKVGSVIVTPENRVISMGYNGFPKGFNDGEGYKLGRDYKLAYTVHSEMNAILQAGKALDGCTLYLYPIPPCSHCLAMIRQAGICRVKVFTPDSKLESFKRWNCSESIELGKDLNVIIEVFYEEEFQKEVNQEAT